MKIYMKISAGRISQISGRKSQSALEYMMTYGWAILIIVVVAVILYSMGIFNPSSSVTATIAGFSSTPVSNAICTSNGVLRFSVGDTTGHRILIKSISGTINGKIVIFIPNSTVDPNPIITQSNTYIFSIPNICPLTGTHFSAAVKVNYTEPTTAFPNAVYTSSGTMTGVVSSTAMPGFVAKLSGPSATGYTFQEVSSIYLPNNSIINKTLKTDNFTISAWVYPIDTSQACEITLLGNWGEFRFGMAGSAVAGAYAGFGGASNDIMLEVFNDTAGSVNQYDYFGGSVSYNNWSYLTVTYNGTFIDFYINGKITGVTSFRALNSSTDPNSQDSYSSFISYGDSGCGGEFVGYLSDVALYNISLGNNKISAFYNDGIINYGTKNTVSLWPLNVSARDYYGNDNGVNYNVIFTSNYPS